MGAVASLSITETPLSATAFIGVILLIGIAANNAIVLVAFIEQLRRAGHSVVEAVRLGALLRLRPKLMTACVAMAALLPLANGRQEGGEIPFPPLRSFLNVGFALASYGGTGRLFLAGATYSLSYAIWREKPVRADVSQRSPCDSFFRLPPERRGARGAG